MEIIPGSGVGPVRIGDRRQDVEERIGPAVHGPGGSRGVYDTTPLLVVHYAPDATVELVEISYSGDAADTEASFDGVQLTHRLLDDVVADLHAKGFTSTPSDLGHDFHAGFSVWSTGSLWAPDVLAESGEAPETDGQDGRPVADGVSVAPYAYFTEGA